MSSNTVRHLGHFKNKLMCELNGLDMLYGLYLKIPILWPVLKKQKSQYFKNESNLCKCPQCVSCCSIQALFFFFFK